MGACPKGLLLRWVGAAVGALPAAWVPRLGGWLSRIGPLTRRRARIAGRNLELAFPGLGPAARERLLHATLASNTTGALDTLCAWFAPPYRLRGTADIEGLDLLADALREGRGAVLVGAHYDGIEMAIRLVAEAARATHGVRSGVLVRRHNDPCIEAVIDAGRTRYVDLTIDKKDVSRFAGVVQDGSAVFYVPDQDASRRNAFVPFFGVPASTLAAIPGVLRRSGGVPLLFWCRRVGDGRISIDIARAPEDFLEGADADVAARYMAWVERRARQSPEQYLWVHRRFKTRPPGEPDLYGRERSARSPSP